MSGMLVRVFVVVLTATVALVASGGVAGAHISVHADDAVPGGSAELAFRVPTESDTASTVSVRLAFPEDTPIARVAVLPTAGWTYQVTTATLPDPVSAGHGDEVSEVVSQIEWRATGAGTAVKPGEYQVFRITAGPLPETDQLVFKVVQTYDDGQAQRWIDEPVAGGPEPEHPAPVLAIGPAPEPASAGHDHGAAPEVVPVASSRAETPAPAWWAAVSIALVALIAALGSVVVAIRTARRGGGERAA